MKHHFFSPGKYALWLALAAAVWGGRTGAEAAGGEDSVGPPSMARPVRQVYVHRVWSRLGKVSDRESGMAICAELEALGLKWRTLLVEVRLRTTGGKPVAVVVPAPEGYADKNGHFKMWARLPVMTHHFQWPELCAAFEHETLLDLAAEEPGRLIASLEASSGGLSSVSEAEIAMGPADVVVQRAVRLLAIDPFVNSPPPDATTGPAKAKLGLRVWGYVEAVGLDGASLVARLALRDSEGEPLRWKEGTARSKRPVESRSEQAVAPNQAQILSHFIPYDALELEPGRHRLVLTYSVSCQGLKASAEGVYVIPVAAPREVESIEVR